VSRLNQVLVAFSFTWSRGHRYVSALIPPVCSEAKIYPQPVWMKTGTNGVLGGSFNSSYTSACMFSSDFLQRAI
jgi:hypothetical protein